MIDVIRINTMKAGAGICVISLWWLGLLRILLLLGWHRRTLVLLLLLSLRFVWVVLGVLVLFDLSV
jgi:hypothetical protein